MKRAWVERAKVWVPSGDEPRCAGKDAVNVRRYIDDELGIICLVRGRKGRRRCRSQPRPRRIAARSTRGTRAPHSNNFGGDAGADSPARVTHQ